MRTAQVIRAIQLVFYVLLYAAVVIQARSTPQQRVVCSGTPAREANIKPWPQRCAGAAAGFTCRAKCIGNSDKATAVCNANGAWSVLSNSCPPVVPSNGCKQQPEAVSGATWACCSSSNSSSAVGTVCYSTTCSPGFIGPGYVATCLPSGKWSTPAAASNSSSIGCLVAVRPESTCLGAPAAVPNAAWDMACVSAAVVGVECTAVCTAAAGSRAAGYTSTCIEGGAWSTPVGEGCTAINSSNGSRPVTCLASPPSMEGVAWEACDTTPGSGRRCFGSCRKPYRGLGYYSLCNAQGEWQAPEKQLKNDVGCRMVSCAGALPKTVTGASWDPSCSTAGTNAAVCFASCVSNASTTAYVSECLMEGVWSEPDKMADC